MNTIYVIIEDTGYDSVRTPHNDEYYTSEEEALKECNKLNKASGSKRDYFDVYELTLKQS